MSHTLQISLADDLVLGMQKDDQALAAEMRLAAAAKWYECGMLSQERAASVAGMQRAEFMVSLTRLGTSPYQETKDEVLDALK